MLADLTDIEKQRIAALNCKACTLALCLRVCKECPFNQQKPEKKDVKPPAWTAKQILEREG